MGENLLEPSFQPPMANNVFRFLLYVFKPVNLAYPPLKMRVNKSVNNNNNNNFGRFLFLSLSLHTFLDILILVERFQSVVLGEPAESVDQVGA